MNKMAGNQSLKTKNIRALHTAKLGKFPQNSPALYKRKPDKADKPIVVRRPQADQPPPVGAPDNAIAPSALSAIPAKNTKACATIACVVLGEAKTTRAVSKALGALDGDLAVTTISVTPDASIASQFEADIILVNSEFDPKKPIRAAALAIYNTTCDYVAIVRSVEAVGLLKTTVTLLRDNKWWLGVLEGRPGIIYNGSYVIARDRVYNGTTIDTELWNLLAQTIELGDKTIAIAL